MGVEVRRAQLVKPYPWWFHLAQLGASVGIGISVATGIAQFVPIAPVQLIAGVVAAAGNAVTCYAQTGVKKAKKT